MDLTLYLKSVFMIGRFNVFWTISAEFQFYVVFVFLWIVGYKLGRPIQFMVIVALLGACGVFWDIHPYPSGPVYKTIQFFAVGILASFAVDRLRTHLSIRYIDPALSVLLVLFFGSLPMLFEIVMGFKHGGFWSPWLLFLSFGIVLCAALSNGRLGRMLGSKIGLFFGNLSFAIYLIHIPVQHFVKYNFETAPWPFSFSMAASFTLILSFLTYQYFEKPLRYIIREGARGDQK